MFRFHFANLTPAFAVAAIMAGASLACAETAEEMARDLVPAQKPLYELGGLAAGSGSAVEAWVDRTERIYAVGQQLKVFVRPKQTSHITVLNVGTSGRVAVIFPNFHQRDMQVRAGQTVSIPASGANWKIDVAGPTGVEVIMVVASKEPLKLPEILKLTGATPERPLLSLGRSGEEVARDLVPQVKDPPGVSTILPGGVKRVLVRIVPRGAASTVRSLASPQISRSFELVLRPGRAAYGIGQSARVAADLESDRTVAAVDRVPPPR